MAPTHLDMGEFIPIAAIVLGILGIGVPTSVFSIARKWTENRPELTGTGIASAAFVSIVSLIIAGILLLAVWGWLPPPTEWRTD